MKLGELLAIFPEYRLGRVDMDASVRSLVFDSRHVRPDSVFIAIRGERADGHGFLQEACRRKPLALVVESDKSVPVEFSGAVVCVPSGRRALAELSARFYSYPSKELFCVGVTGTNGKTSVTYMVEHILNFCGRPTGVLGTIDHHFNQRSWPGELTTPDPIKLQSRLKDFAQLGAKACALEVSSHALSQGRVDAVDFDVAVFTNLTRDHLDYHQTMEDYFLAKQRLFLEVLNSSSKKATWAIVNLDDPYGQRLEICGSSQVWTYGQKNADLEFSVIRTDFFATEFLIKTPRGERQARVPVPGLHSVYNATAAIGVALSAGISLDIAVEALNEFLGVPGRLQRVHLPQKVQDDLGLNIFVDYAHTDDALRSVLGALRQIRKQTGHLGRIVTLFGCGGDRDQGKRPLMTRAATELSDLVWVTSDNPRTEDPQKIIDDCLAQLEPELLNKQVFTEVDRGKAIHQVLSGAQRGDIILIAGKGHEDYQIIGQTRYPFSDQQVVKEFYR